MTHSEKEYEASSGPQSSVSHGVQPVGMFKDSLLRYVESNQMTSESCVLAKYLIFVFSSIVLMGENNLVLQSIGDICQFCLPSIHSLFG